MPNPCPNTKWTNEKGALFIVTEYWFCSKGDSVVFENVTTGQTFERSLLDVMAAIKEGKLKRANDF